MAIEEAARQRVAVANERTLLQQMDILSQKSELFSLQQKVGEQNNALMQLEHLDQVAIYLNLQLNAAS